MSNFEYKKKGDDYILCNNSEEIYNVGSEIAISYTYWKDEDGNSRGFILKHGAQEMVLEYHNNTVKAYKDQMGEEKNETMNKLAEKILNESFYACGIFELEEINKCLAISDYITKVHEKEFLNN